MHIPSYSSTLLNGLCLYQNIRSKAIYKYLKSCNGVMNLFKRQTNMCNRRFPFCNLKAVSYCSVVRRYNKILLGNERVLFILSSITQAKLNALCYCSINSTFYYTAQITSRHMKRSGERIQRIYVNVTGFNIIKCQIMNLMISETLHLKLQSKFKIVPY